MTFGRPNNLAPTGRPPAIALRLLAGDLERPEHPAQALPEEPTHGSWSLRVRDGARLVEDSPAGALQPDRRIGILCERRGLETSDRQQGHAAPRADRSGNHSEAIDRLERTPIQVLIGRMCSSVRSGGVCA
jgi:hypothetical protein